MRTTAARLAAAPALLLVLGPATAGLLGTLLPAFGWLPALGHATLSLEPWRRLLATPGLGRSVLLAVTSGAGSTLLALALAVAIAAALHGRPGERRLRALLPPLLAVPHAAVAVGFAFLVAPSGLLVRLAAPLLGLERPPELATVQDPWALALTVALALREAPFLLFVILAADRPGLDHQLAAARALGRSPVAAWLEVALPQLWPSLRLPTLAVLAYGLSAVDMALVLGPTTPPPLAVLLLRWMADPDLDRRLPASAGAVLALALTLALVLLARLAEAAFARPRPVPARLAATVAGLGRGAALLVPASALAGLLVLLAWSLAASWRFPALLPTGPDLAAWRSALPLLGGVALGTAGLGLATVAVALPATIAALEAPRGGGRAMALLWLPLLLPQIGFVFGLQVLVIRLGLADRLAGLVLAHLVMVLPYTWLVLRGPWAGLDPRLAAAARCLGCGRLGALVRVVLPALLGPLLAAAAVGFSVSVAQYLVTLAAGGGRFPTLATETMALVAGGDRRRIGMAAALLALLPLLATGLALALPALLGRRRRRPPPPRGGRPQLRGSGANRLSTSSSVKARPAPPPPSTPS